jgi:hypothetical protein
MACIIIFLHDLNYNPVNISDVTINCWMINLKKKLKWNTIMNTTKKIQLYRLIYYS